MKTLSQLLEELEEALSIYSNPNAFTPLDSGIETPRERKLRIAFDKRLAASGAKAVYDREEKRLQKIWAAQKAGKISSRQPFPWENTHKDIPGWWHPVKPWFTFNHSRDGYHVTQIVKKPGVFGIGDSELKAAALKYTRIREYQEVTPGDILDEIENESLDLCMPVQALAYQKGWCKVYGGKLLTVEGTDDKSLKAAAREILSVVPEKKLRQDGVVIYKPYANLEGDVKHTNLYYEQLMKYAT
jgi:hypothetical protein